MEKNFQTLQVGATYRDEDGNEITINLKDEIKASSPFVFRDTRNTWFTSDGECAILRQGCRFNLIELILPPTPTYTIAPLWWEAGYGIITAYTYSIVISGDKWCTTLNTFHDTLYEAKAHCQAHHEEQVKKLLLPA